MGDGPDNTADAVDEQTVALVDAIIDATAQIVSAVTNNKGMSLTELTRRVTTEQNRLARAAGR